MTEIVIAVLHDPAVLASRLDHLAAFPKVVRDRLFDVDILSGLAGPNRDQRVSVVSARE
jgi:hypothetical protein